MTRPRLLLPVLRNPVVRRTSAYFGSDRRNLEFDRLCKEHGKRAFESTAE
jgi:hypothetical protein